jgi:hypothetical protein
MKTRALLSAALIPPVELPIERAGGKDELYCTSLSGIYSITRGFPELPFNCRSASGVRCLVVGEDRTSVYPAGSSSRRRRCSGTQASHARPGLTVSGRVVLRQAAEAWVRAGRSLGLDSGIISPSLSAPAASANRAGRGGHSRWHVDARSRSAGVARKNTEPQRVGKHRTGAESDELVSAASRIRGSRHT